MGASSPFPRLYLPAHTCVRVRARAEQASHMRVPPSADISWCRRLSRRSRLRSPLPVDNPRHHFLNPGETAQTLKRPHPPPALRRQRSAAPICSSVPGPVPRDRRSPPLVDLAAPELIRALFVALQCQKKKNQTKPKKRKQTKTNPSQQHFPRAPSSGTSVAPWSWARWYVSGPNGAKTSSPQLRRVAPELRGCCGDNRGGDSPVSGLGTAPAVLGAGQDGSTPSPAVGPAVSGAASPLRPRRGAVMGLIRRFHK